MTEPRKCLVTTRDKQGNRYTTEIDYEPQIGSELYGEEVVEVSTL